MTNEQTRVNELEQYFGKIKLGKEIAARLVMHEQENHCHITKRGLKQLKDTILNK